MIDRSNFKQTRKAYHITLNEVSERCKLSNSVVSSFENFTGQYTQVRTRDDNARSIIQALSDIISEKLAETFPNASSHVERNTLNMTGTNEESTEVTKPVRKISVNGYDKSKVALKLKAYCSAENIVFSEFCKMCGVSHATFAPYSIKNAPIVRPHVLSRICSSAGIDITTFDECKLSHPASNDQLIPDSTEISENSNSNDEITLDELVNVTSSCTKQADQVAASNQIAKGTTIQNETYTFCNGIYIKEYDEVIVTHIREVITREEFLKHV